MKIEYLETDLLQLVNDFRSEFKTILPVSFQKEQLGRIRIDSTILDSLKNKTGIYYFLQGGKVKYVGRALPTVGIRSRIISQISAFGDPLWDTVITDENVEIGVVIFEQNNWYFVSALEHYLIDKLQKPVFNKRY
ncbi:hypothetical protein QYF50_05735 [Paenibacillus vini]|uniref:hypothetical protein n=1 Tax=Paenibacillus vini TaxID=1476024 RepID=UPI0025B6844C|nr:hypothetical protein [Paenibacillus vini]MDN4067391.1 hypothetical protein [Paenibacillus vini]